VDFREDVVGSENLMRRIAENYRTIRNNLFKNSLGNLFDFHSSNAVPFADMEAIDQYMLRLTCKLAADVVRWYEEFAFHKIYQRINHFCVVDLSAFYADIVKDRLYTYAADSRGRRSAQTVFWRIMEATVRLLAPIMSFTCDELWQYLSVIGPRPESVHMTEFPTTEDILGTKDVATDDQQQQQDWETLRTVRDQVLKALEEARNQKTIGKSLEAQVKVVASDPVYSVLEKYKRDLRYSFIVSQVELERGPSRNGNAQLAVNVSKATGEKCERCWNYSTHVGENEKYPTICERCLPVVRQLEADGGNAPSNS
jgi:isoleucyl-tRNA synthetase